MKYFFTLLLITSLQTLSAESECYGTTSNGHLKNGVKLPASGSNYTGYSSIARVAGRTHVHSEVRNIIVSSYKLLEAEQPNKVFKYAETGFKDGGLFKPHKTHKNGLSVDFMVPVINNKGESVHLPTTPFNKFGYNIEFNGDSEYKEFKIDYEAMAAHIVSLDKTAKELGYDLWRVIFDPKMQPNLFETTYGEYLQNNIKFSEKRSWVRHDEHYHIDFEIPCEE